MATIIGSTNTSVWSFKLEVIENSTSIENNGSKVTVTAFIGRPSSAGASYLYGASISCPVSVTGAGTKTITYNNANQVDVAAGGWLNIGSVVFDNVPHDVNGSKTVTVSASFTNNISPSSGSAKGTVKLTDIPRASTFTIDKTSIYANGTDKITVTINPKNTAYKHTVTVAFGSSYNQTFNVAAGTKTLAFTIPYNWLNGIPAQESSNSTNIILTTYNGATLIGTASLPKGFTIMCPSDVVPTISSVTITGKNLRNGVYVQGKSSATIKTVAGGVYGSNIKNYSCVVDGVKYTSSEFTTAAFKTASQYTITVTVTDSRGRTASKSATAFTVYEYKPPYITSFKAERQTDGTTVVATLVGGVSSLNGQNGKAFSVTLNGVTKVITSSGFTVNGTATFTDVDTDSTFVATAKIADYYTQTTRPVVVPTEAVTMDFHYSGKGAAFGKVSERENTLESAWPVRVSGTHNQNSWGKSNKGAVTQVIDESGSQHAAIVGVNAKDERVYSIEFFDKTSTANMKLYAGTDNLAFGTLGLFYNNYGIPYLVPLWSGTLYTVNSTATLNQSIANFKYLEIYFHDNDGYYDSTRIRVANGTAISANVGHTAIGSSGYLKQMAVRFNGTTLTVNSNQQIAISTTTGTGAANNGVITAGQFITIDAIIGIK